MDAGEMIFETFSQRKRKKLQAGELDVFVYDEAPHHMRHQICMTLHEGIGLYHVYSDYNFHSVSCANEIWEQIDRFCRKEIYSYLEFCVEEDLAKRFFDFLIQAKEIDEFLDAVEIGCIGLHICSGHPQHRGAQTSNVDALEEINARFTQHSVGYQFENKQIIRVDSKFVHQEIIKPALQILSKPEFSSANAEFMTAHKHYRDGNYKDAVTAANRSFESMLKIICDLQGWLYNKTDRATELIAIVNKNGLFSHQFDKAFLSYIAMLKSGVPGIRNDAGAHGDGMKGAAVTAQIARFAVNMTASNITFLAECLSA